MVATRRKTPAPLEREGPEAKAYLEPDEVVLLEKAATCLRDQVLVRMLFRLGCRISELLGLTPGDINLRTGAVTIQRLKVRLRLRCPDCNVALGRRHRYCPGCGKYVEQAVAEEAEKKRLRVLYLDRETLALVREFLGAIGPRGRVFPIARNTAWRIVKECAYRAGIFGLVNPDNGRPRGVSPHRLRDAFAVHALKLDSSGDGMRLLQEWLGHERFDTTARYRKVAGTELQDWMGKLWDEKQRAGQVRQQQRPSSFSGARR